MSKKGFTLIELAIVVVLATIAVYSMLTIFMTAATRNVDSESLTMAFYLANGKLEETSGKSYHNISSEATLPFGSGFSDFNSEVIVQHVSSEALDLAVATDFGCKKVIVRVTSSILSSPIEIATLVTDVSNE